MAGSNSFSLTSKRWIAATNVMAAPQYRSSGGYIYQCRKGTPEFRWMHLPMSQGHTGVPVDTSANVRRAHRSSGGCICKCRRGTPEFQWMHLQMSEGHTGVPVDASANVARAHRTSGVTRPLIPWSVSHRTECRGDDLPLCL
jgi:hypothetical protein